ncbi:MAG: hypothetical protein R3E87_15045 [Burkholderiaceae bacterium]
MSKHRTIRGAPIQVPPFFMVKAMTGAMVAAGLIRFPILPGLKLHAARAQVTGDLVGVWVYG